MYFLEIIGLIYLLGVGIALTICLLWTIYPCITGKYNGNPKVRSFKAVVQTVAILLLIASASWFGAVILWFLGVDERASNKVSLKEFR